MGIAKTVRKSEALSYFCKMTLSSLSAKNGEKDSHLRQGYGEQGTDPESALCKETRKHMLDGDPA